MSKLKQPRYFISVAIWLLIIASFYYYSKASGLSINTIIQAWLQQLSNNKFAPLLLLIIFAIRPILLLPVSILSAFAGFLFGPVLGILYALLATLFSASIAYGIGYLFANSKKEVEIKLLKNLQENSFESILISRLIFVPGDLVNFSAGFLKISFWQFLVATSIGGLPGLAMTVLAGASIENDFSFSGIKINIYYLLASLALLVFSLAMSRFLRLKKRKST